MEQDVERDRGRFGLDAIGRRSIRRAIVDHGPRVDDPLRQVGVELGRRIDRLDRHHPRKRRGLRGSEAWGQRGEEGVIAERVQQPDPVRFEGRARFKLERAIEVDHHAALPGA